MADMQDGDFVLVPLEVPADAILKETFAPVLRVDRNGTLREVNEHGRPILAIAFEVPLLQFINIDILEE
jgi:hypothetical protein